MDASLSFESSNEVHRPNGLKYVVLAKVFNEIVHVGAHHVPACSIVAADFVCDSRFVVSPLHQFEDLGSDNIQAKHLTVMDVEENSSIHCLCSPNCVGYSEHDPWVSGGLGFGASAPEDCSIWPRRIPETSVVVRIGAAQGRKPV